MVVCISSVGVHVCFWQTAMLSQRSRDKTLLVKVIKANGLGDKNISKSCVIDVYYIMVVLHRK